MQSPFFSARAENSLCASVVSIHLLAKNRKNTKILKDGAADESKQCFMWKTNDF